MKTLLSLVVSILLAASVVAPVVGAQDAGHSDPAAQAEHAQVEHAQDHADAPSTMEMPNAGFFTGLYVHLVPHLAFDDHGHGSGEVGATGAAGEAHGPSLFAFYNVNLWQLYAVGLIFVIFGLVLASFRGSSTPWVLRVFRGWCRWLRDEVLIDVMGPEEGRRFAPYFIFLFFFIAFLNLLSMIPGGVTANASIFVTGSLAVVTFGIMLVGGMMHNGVAGFWKGLLPHGLPLALVPLMFVLEVIGLLVKPFALTIRLFANMLAGHLVVYSFIAMIFLFAKMLEMSAVAYLPAVAAVGMSVFISIIEAFVALLQAYIFTYLSVIFVQGSFHQSH